MFRFVELVIAVVDVSVRRIGNAEAAVVPVAMPSLLSCRRIGNCPSTVVTVVVVPIHSLNQSVFLPLPITCRRCRRPGRHRCCYHRSAVVSWLEEKIPQRFRYMIYGNIKSAVKQYQNHFITVGRQAWWDSRSCFVRLA